MSDLRLGIHAVLETEDVCSVSTVQRFAADLAVRASVSTLSSCVTKLLHSYGGHRGSTNTNKCFIRGLRRGVNRAAWRLTGAL